MVTKHYQYKESIVKIISSCYSYDENRKAGVVSFTIDGKDLQFSLLEQVSQLLQTKHINIHSEGSNTCCGSGEYCYCTDDSQIQIYCEDVIF